LRNASAEIAGGPGGGGIASCLHLRPEAVRLGKTGARDKAQGRCNKANEKAHGVSGSRTSARTIARREGEAMQEWA
jgi:hypothetical protein